MAGPSIQGAREATARCQKGEAPGNGSLSPGMPISYPIATPATEQTPVWF